MRGCEIQDRFQNFGIWLKTGGIFRTLRIVRVWVTRAGVNSNSKVLLWRGTSPDWPARIHFWGVQTIFIYTYLIYIQHILQHRAHTHCVVSEHSKEHVGTETARISCAVSSFTSVNASVHFSLECWLNTAQIISNPNVPWLHKTLYRGYNMIIHPMMGVLVISGNGHVNLMILWNINGLMTIHHPLEKWQLTPVLIMMIMAPWHI